jgi:hypothetical protein
MRIRTLIFALAVLPSALAAQATVTEPVQDPVYRDLDRLFGAGVIKTMVVGQKPYSRREIARMIVSAVKAPAWGGLSSTHRRMLDRLSREYSAEIAALGGDSLALRRASLDIVHLELLGTNAKARPIPDEGVGNVAADVNPLLNGRAGRTYRDGMNAAVESEASFRPANNLVLRVRPRFVATAGGSGGSFAQGSIEAASATLLVRNIVAEVGRQQQVWGQGMEGGLLGSTSGRPLDMIRIANDTPFFLWPFGPARASIVAIDLGPNQTFPHSKIIGYRLSGNPFWARFELSASVMSEQGGSGSPSVSLFNRLIDLVPAIEYPLKSKANVQFSNKFAGWEYRLRLPELSGLQLYAEHQFDDMDSRRWKSTLWEDGGHILGFSFAQMGPLADVSFAGEFHHTGLRYYQHAVFTSGYAVNRTLIGDPLGNKGDGGYARIAWDAGTASSLTLDGAIERRLGNLYDTAFEGDGNHQTNFHFVVTTPQPDEWRHRVMATWAYRPVAPWRASVQAGVERARNLGFVQNVSRNGFLAAASIEVLPP